MLRVTARPVDMSTNPITIEEVKKPEFWTSNTSDDIVRVFPASGWIGLSDILYAQESLGSFWSATSYDARKSWYMVFGRANSRIDIHFAVYYYSVRLFETVSHWIRTRTWKKEENTLREPFLQSALFFCIKG